MLSAQHAGVVLPTVQRYGWWCSVKELGSAWHLAVSSLGELHGLAIQGEIVYVLVESPPRIAQYCGWLAQPGCPADAPGRARGS